MRTRAIRKAYGATLIAALIIMSLASCAQTGGNAEKLAQDFAKTGIVPGKPLPGSVKMAVNKYGYSTTPGQSFYYCGNGFIQLDASKNLVGVEIVPPEIKMSTDLTLIDITTWKGKPLFNMTKTELLKAYGKPSEDTQTTGGIPTNRLLMYYFRTNDNKLIGIRLAFPTAGPDIEKLYGCGIRIVDDYEASAIQAKNTKVFPWPKGV